MQIEKIANFLKGEAGKAVKQLDKFIDYYEKNKGDKPESVKLSKKAYDDIAKKLNDYCKQNRIKRDGVMTYRNVRLEK